ncbi:ATP-binding protein [Bradyrhizobium japonicum]|uniref:ATP-binding protein n=1 Tax=Bradyrhizobium japonicum TaxID=375 RepID=UPI001BA8BD87|nr:ATP-binding protein [Bradyrhizobium japonicum]MBR0960895.1 ATP-binding protein [Bradyrhizobium japonicum]
MSSDPNRPSVYSPFLRRFTDEIALDLSETIALYRDVKREHEASTWSAKDIVERIHRHCVEIIEQAAKSPEYQPLCEALDRCQKAIIKQEATLVSFPEIDFGSRRLSMKEMVDLRRFLRAKQHFLSNQDRVFGQLCETLCVLFAGILGELPPISSDDSPTLSVPLVSLLPKPGEIIDKLIGTIITTPLINAGLFTALQKRLYENQCRVSKVDPNAESSRPLVDAEDADLPPEELLDAYLGGTPFLDLFKTNVPFELPQHARFEHHWIVGGSGHGKTNALSNLIIDDLQRVADGEASIVVIDSQNSLVPTIAHLPVFAPGEMLDGKLVLVDASDVEYPVALNLFDVGLKRLDTYSLLDRERLLNTASEVMEFILSSLLGADMTSRQSTLFGFALQAMQLIPNATIHTFRELMEPGGRKKFAPYLEKLQGRAREFFDSQFDATIFSQTKQQVVARLYAICENRTFDRMLSNPQTKLDLFEEINAGKVILINTAKDLLKGQGTETFGRFLLALLAQAAQERATIHPTKRLPCFVYIDECQDYLSTDSNFTMILEQARKQNVGMIVAHQYLSQLSQNTLDSLYANTSIKFAGGVSDKDAYALARNMRCEPSFIAEQGKGSFAAYVRNTTKSAVSLKFKLLHFGANARMSNAEYARVRDGIRAKYAVHYTTLLAPPPQTPAPVVAASPTVAPPAEPKSATAPQAVPALPKKSKTAEKPNESSSAKAEPEPPKRKKWPME